MNAFLRLLFFALLLPAVAHAEASSRVLRLDIDGTINPAVADYVAQGIDLAEERGYDLLLIRIDTPGGLLEATRSIVKSMLASELPIVTWVAPPGARAASAGMFITLAGHVAVMANGTNIGAATPINTDGKDVDKEGGEDLARKVLEDTRAFARSIAEVRHRPAQWMEDAVSEAVSITASEALEKNVVDAIADTEIALLRTLDGKPAGRAPGAATLTTAGAIVERFDMSAGQRIMHQLAHPNIAYLLMLLGMLGIYFELSAPGGFIAGTLGSISLLLAFISFQVLPFRMGGLLLILLAIALFVAEVFVPSMGILTIGGFVSFVVGSLILFNTPELDVRLDPELIAGATAAFGVCALLIGFLVLRAQRRKAVTGAEALLGQSCEALTTLDPDGKVFLNGEIWDAALREGTADRGDRLVVVDRDGLHLTVAHPDPHPHSTPQGA
ncbi:MAG: nodulation protein NfeD [Candidatus Dadabacteria bacterium]|nr:MAG: nodulation protein NfeD [Candidatus Dadabacteria bacterium]